MRANELAFHVVDDDVARVQDQIAVKELVDYAATVQVEVRDSVAVNELAVENEPTASVVAAPKFLVVPLHLAERAQEVVLV